MAFQLCEFQQFDNNGEPLSGGKVNVYEAGATTAKDSFPTADDADAGTNANANPVVLDSAGRGQIWGKSGEAYKLVITDSADVTLETIDDITAPTNNPLKVYTAGGTADALTITLDPNPGAWSTGVSFYFRPVSANTGSATININGIGAKTLKLPDASTNLPAGYLQTGNTYGIWYDGTNAVVVSRSRQFMGALVNKSAAQSIANSAAAVLTWDTEQFDEGDWHSTSTNTSRLTVPDGVRLVRAYANTRFDDNSTGYRQLQIIKNGSTFVGTPNARTLSITSASQPTLLSINTGPIKVSSGDYFEVEVFQNSGGALDVQNDNTTWFSIEAIE